MGQRLNLEIHSDGELLANAYYHWGAYTSSSIATLGMVLEAYRKTKEVSPLGIAVDILQATYAGINVAEKARIKEDKSGKFDGIDFNDAIDRNRGLLSVTKEGMEDTRSWGEGRVTVDIGKEEFIFEVMWTSSADDYDMGGGPVKSYDLKDTSFDFCAPCPFCDFEKYVKEHEAHPDGVWIDEDTILYWIE